MKRKRKLHGIENSVLSGCMEGEEEDRSMLSSLDACPNRLHGRIYHVS